jgi:hypothetical protein
VPLFRIGPLPDRLQRISDRRKGMPKDMRCHILELRLQANAVQDPNHADEVAISPISWKDERRTVTTRQRFDTGDRSFSQNADLRTALGAGKADAMFRSAKPEALQESALPPLPSGLANALRRIFTDDVETSSMTEQSS